VLRTINLTGLLRPDLYLWTALETIQEYYRIDRREISFLRFIIEAYDGIALLRTVDPGQGIIALHIAPGFEYEVHMILEDLKTSILIEPIDPVE